MDTIKLLNKLEVGTPLVVTTKWQDTILRKVTLYAGVNDIGVYSFIDDNGPYRVTPGYIREHITISQELDQDTDTLELAKLIKTVKGGE